MQHPVRLILNPQRVPHCRLLGREDTKTGPEPLETQKHESDQPLWIEDTG